MNKQQLRQRILETRSALSADVRRTKSQAIFQHVISLPQVAAAKTIMTYLDFRGEVETDLIFVWGWELGKIMAAPVTIRNERKLYPLQIHTFAELKIGAFGIREPNWDPLTESAPQQIVSLNSIDVVLIPGVAFDRKGGRIGYGGGFYDRFLPQLRPDTLKIGLAFDLQVTELLPTEAHDITLDILVTETVIWNFRE